MEELKAVPEEITQNLEVESTNLTSGEMLRIDQEIAEIKNCNYELELMSSKRDIVLLKMDQASKQYELLGYKKKEMDEEIKKKQDLMHTKKAAHKGFLEGIQTKYNITKRKWGFNPDTGAIV